MCRTSPPWRSHRTRLRAGWRRVESLDYGDGTIAGLYENQRADREASADTIGLSYYFVRPVTERVTKKSTQADEWVGYAQNGSVMFKLISATPSPYTRKVRIALLEKGLPFELITEVPWDSTTSTPRYNPLEKLPILILEDGSSVYESSLILQYLEWKVPKTPLLAGDVDGMLAA